MLAIISTKFKSTKIIDYTYVRLHLYLRSSPHLRLQPVSMSTMKLTPMMQAVAVVVAVVLVLELVELVSEGLEVGGLYRPSSRLLQRVINGKG